MDLTSLIVRISKKDLQIIKKAKKYLITGKNTTPSGRSKNHNIIFNMSLKYNVSVQDINNIFPISYFNNK